MVGFKDVHGIVGALAVHALHGIGAHAEDVDVVNAHLLIDFYICAVHGAQGHGAPFIMNFMLPVPLASLPAVESC